MPTDIEIARSVTPLPITEVAKNAGVDVKHLIPYGFDKAKVDYSLLNEPTDHQAKLVLVTAINPTPAGEGKTTTTIGLADGLRRRGVKSAVALREPSLGPVFGVKGGAAGGGWAQVIPMEDINLHFTGDFHAIGAANNLLAAMLDNHIQQGNQLGIDVKRITWKRVVDMNDRQLRHVIDGIGGKAQGVPREDGFDITVASEVMAILCLSTSISDLKERLGEIVVGYSYAGEPVRARDLKAQGAMAAQRPRARARPPRPSVWPTACVVAASRVPLPCASLRSAPSLALRAVLPAAAGLRSSPWRISTCTLPATSTLSVPPITCWPPCLITTSSRAISSVLTLSASLGSASSI